MCVCVYVSVSVFDLHDAAHISEVELVVRPGRGGQQVLARFRVDLQGGRHHAGGALDHAAVELLAAEVPFDDGAEDAHERGALELHQTQQAEVPQQSDCVCVCVWCVCVRVCTPSKTTTEPPTQPLSLSFSLFLSLSLSHTHTHTHTHAHTYAPRGDRVAASSSRSHSAHQGGVDDGAEGPGLVQVVVPPRVHQELAQQLQGRLGAVDLHFRHVHVVHEHQVAHAQWGAVNAFGNERGCT